MAERSPEGSILMFATACARGRGRSPWCGVGVVALVAYLWLPALASGQFTPLPGPSAQGTRCCPCDPPWTGCEPAFVPSECDVPRDWHCGTDPGAPIQLDWASGPAGGTLSSTRREYGPAAECVAAFSAFAGQRIAARLRVGDVDYATDVTGCCACRDACPCEAPRARWCPTCCECREAFHPVEPCPQDAHPVYYLQVILQGHTPCPGVSIQSGQINGSFCVVLESRPQWLQPLFDAPYVWLQRIATWQQGQDIGEVYIAVSVSSGPT